jgi:hypothetical protein
MKTDLKYPGCQVVDLNYSTKNRVDWEFSSICPQYSSLTPKQGSWMSQAHCFHEVGRQVINFGQYQLLWHISWLFLVCLL